MKPRIGLIACLAGLSACSWFGGQEPANPPTPLTEFESQATVRELWSKDIGAGAQQNYLRLEPALTRDVLYVTDARGHVQALALPGGRVLWEVSLWRAQVTSEVLAPPVISNGVAVVQCVDGRLHALKLEDGQRLWSIERSEPALSLRGTATPVVVSDLVFAGQASGKMLAASLKDGRVIWEIPVAQSQGRSEIERLIDVDSPVLVAGRVLIAAAYQGKVVAVSLDNGRLLWSRDISTYLPLASDGAHVFISDDRGHLLALDLNSGATVWKQEKLQNRRPSAPAVVGAAVAVGDFEGYVHWLSREDGRFLARTRASSYPVVTTPLADTPLLYVITQNGKLFAYRIDPRAP
jgi:outer membrane protein assembly factor BamB